MPESTRGASFTLVHEHLVRSAVEFAERPALVGAESLSYAQLGARAQAFATNLRRAGLALGDRVAIWLPKSSSYVAAIYGTLLAGGVYVPLDVGHPAPRVGLVLTDAEPTAVVTDVLHLSLLIKQGLPTSVRCIWLVDVEPAPWVEDPRVMGLPFTPSPSDPAEALPAVGASDLAALLYTSGSTGVPKGVQISHLNLASFIDWTRTELRLSAGDVFSQHASMNFDLSTFDVFASASVGAALWIVSEAESRSVAALLAGIERHRVTVWYSVPSILSLLAGSGGLTPEVTSSLRYVLFAGEPFPMRGLRELAALLPESTELYNWYGPTETNVCTYHRVRPSDLAQGDPLPIGRPLPHVSARIVDEHGAVLEGEAAVGELVIGGPCVTPGYFRREDAKNASNHRCGLHATGDLVERREGLLVYRGRKDRMLKINGYRVELGEIEAVLGRHPALGSAAAVALRDDVGTRLVAFYTLRHDAQPPSLLELKAYLREHLPRYMVPHAFHRVSALPHNANGKTDYLALSKLDPAAHGL